MRTHQTGAIAALRDVGAAVALSLLLILAGQATAAESDKEKAALEKPPQPTDAAYEKAKGDALDAYIAGRLITAFALSEHLSPFGLAVDVKDARVLLSGTVENSVQRDLAIEIANGIEQARSVTSEIRVDPDRARGTPHSDGGGNFAQVFYDAGITARVKTRLLLNGSTGGLDIEVDTESQAVQLSGEVDSTVEAALAEQIALNTRGVERVQNQLTVPMRRTSAAAAALNARGSFQR